MKQWMKKSASCVTVLVLVMNVLTGCVHKTGGVYPKPDPPQIANVHFILHGPFALVLRKNAVEALAPRDNDHELVYPDVTQTHRQKSGCKLTIEFTLTGVEPDDETDVDRAFRPVAFDVRDWKRSENEDLFASLKLPRPRRIYAMGPLIPAKFGSNLAPTQYVPLSAVLDFQAKDAKNVKLTLIEVTTCGTNKASRQRKVLGPQSCQEMKKKYDTYFDTYVDPDPAESQRPFLRDEFRRCTDNSLFFFVGLGLPGNFAPHDMFAQRGLEFFNTQLLPLVFGKNIPPKRKLVQIGAEAPRDAVSHDWDSPRLVPAVYRTPRMRPLLVTFAGTENCTSPGIVVNANSSTATTH